jgi:hypothetical protein
MDTARAVVVSIGSTAGLAWELNALSARGHLGKSVFVIPPGTPEEVRSRWLATRAVIDDARGRPFVEPVAVVGTLTVRIDESTGRVSATRADRVDEAAYRAAIAHAVHPTADSRGQETTAIAPWPAPLPSTLVGGGAATVQRQPPTILSTQRRGGQRDQGAPA